MSDYFYSLEMLMEEYMWASLDPEDWHLLLQDIENENNQ